MKKFKQLREDAYNKFNKDSIAKKTTAPALLVLKRRGIRVYPDGQQVALYFNDRFNMIFTVPFGPSRLMSQNPNTPVMGTPR